MTWLWGRLCDQAATSVRPEACERIYFPGFARAVRCIIPLRPCMRQPFLGVWVLLVEYRSLDSSGDDLVFGRNAWLDSGFWSATVLGFWTNYTHFLRRRGLGFGRFCSILMQNGEVRSIDASI